MPTGIYKRTIIHKANSSKGGLKNLGKKLSLEHKKRISETLIKQNIKKQKHFNWKGDNISYHGLHARVYRELGKPLICINCKNTRLNSKNYHWANISGEYKKDLNDFMRLCAGCHKKYDTGHLSISDKKIQKGKKYYKSDFMLAPL